MLSLTLAMIVASAIAEQPIANAEPIFVSDLGDATINSLMPDSMKGAADAVVVEDVETLLAKADEPFALFEAAMSAYRAANGKSGELDLWRSVQKARYALQGAFERDESHAALAADALAAKLWQLYEGSLLYNSPNHLEGKKHAQAQVSFLNMVARVAKNAIGQGDGQLGKKWLVRLMRLHYDASSSKWREYKRELIDAGLLPESFVRPGSDSSVKDELR